MRTVPLQQRSSQRIADFLAAADAIMAEQGYEATTMTAIAERAGASIGALYRWFPDKLAVAQELRDRYRREMDLLFSELVEEARDMTVEQFCSTLIDRIVDFTRRYPAWLPLHDAPIKPRGAAARQNLREELARTLRVLAPDLPRERSILVANVALEIVKGLIASFRNAPGENRELLRREFNLALTLYLSQSLTTTQ